MTDRTCTKCKQVKPATLEYFRFHQNKAGLRPDCRVCNVEQHAEWRAANREAIRLRAVDYRAANRDRLQAAAKQYYRDNKVVRLDQNRALKLRTHYGLSVDQYLAILESQAGVCAYCGKPPKKRPLDVDHDHATGKVRGLLCAACNGGLGKLGDSIEGLLKMVEYLRSVDARIDAVMPDGTAYRPAPSRRV